MTEFKTHECPKEKRYCLQFETDNRDYFLRVQTAAENCMDHKPLTNYERIKAMTVEEMANFLMDFVTEALTNPRCIVVKNWLKDEVQEDD